MRISDWSSDVCSSDLVGDLRVGLPDLRPQPWMLQELARDVPQGVAAHDDIGIGVIATDALCHGVARHHQQCDCKTRAKPPRKALKHAGHLLAPLGIFRNFPIPAGADRKSTRLNSSNSCASR